jgi:hypothetical protein
VAGACGAPEVQAARELDELTEGLVLDHHCHRHLTLRVPQRHHARMSLYASLARAYK